MDTVIVLVKATQPDYKKKVLGVTLLGRLINELAMLRQKEVIVLTESKPDEVLEAIKREVLPSISTKILAASKETNSWLEVMKKSECSNPIVLIPAEVILSRSFLKRCLATPVPQDRAISISPTQFRSQKPPKIVKVGVLLAKRVSQDIMTIDFELNLPTDHLQVEGFCDTVENAQNLRQAKWMLLRSLTKPIEIDGFLCYFLMRPVTLRITARLVHTFLLPNHLTILTALTGLTGAALVAFGNYWASVIGAGLYFAGCFFDCLDGEMARLKYKMSYVGAWLDTVSDDIQTFFFIGGMGIHLLRDTGDQMHLEVALGAMLLYAATQAYVYFQLHFVFHSGDLLDFKFAWEQKNQKQDGKDKQSNPVYTAIKYLFKRDFFTFLVFVLFVFHVPAVALYTMVGSILVFSLVIGFHIYRSARHSQGINLRQS